MNTCPYVCNNKTEFGYCCSTVCINPKYNQRTINGGLTGDYVQVVRCKDCKVKDEERCPWWHGVPEDEFYCAGGERKDDADNR